MDGSAVHSRVSRKPPDLLPYQQRDRQLTPVPSAPPVYFRCKEPRHITRLCPLAMECNVATCYLASETGNGAETGDRGETEGREIHSADREGQTRKRTPSTSNTHDGAP
ncbi:UNVERIFIED_CONTAM: hypothetical protein FKN15_002553 [Acipenser sinensis]